MKTRTAALLFCAVMGAPAATPPLGFLTTEGSFQLDQSKIWGTATLFEGSLVETKVASVAVHLNGGSRIELAAGSRARFYAGRVAIEQGALRLESSAAYRVDASAYQLSAGPAATVASVRLEGTGGLAASASTGRLLIASAAGLPLADVPPGNAVKLSPENSAIPGLTKLSGCVQSSKNSFLLTDQASNIPFLIQGKSIEEQAGNRVEITGTAKAPAAKGTPAVVEVSGVKVLEKGACKATAARKGAVAVIAGGISAKTAAVVAVAAAKPVAVAIIGGVAVAGSVGTVEAAHALAADYPAGTSR